MYWTTLKHNGPYFLPQTFNHTGMKLKYSDSYITLTPDEEEYVYYYFKYMESKYFSNKFKLNFWNSWCTLFNKKLNIDDIDESHLKNYFDNTFIEKIQKDIPNKFKSCIIDNNEQMIVNYIIEPPGIFIGRGDNSKIGTIKKRILPSDVIINVSNSFIPKPNIKGEWKQVIENNTLNWLASWYNPITEKTIYMYPARNSINRMEMSRMKFDNARLLKKYINKIRKKYTKLIDSSLIQLSQIGVVVYFIDNFLIRIGTTKKKHTYGISTIRKKHLKLLDDNRIHLTFPGKDSIMFDRTLSVSSLVYQKLLYFFASSDDYIFYSISSLDVNNYLRKFLPFLTAKIFRTFHSSVQFEKSLTFHIKKFDPMVDDNLKLVFKLANADVAHICNHFKESNFNQKEQIKKLKEKLKKKSLNENTIEKIKKEIYLKKYIKNYNLSTSIQNYIDPRLIYNFSKTYSIDLNKLVSKQILVQLSWGFKQHVFTKY